VCTLCTKVKVQAEDGRLQSAKARNRRIPQPSEPMTPERLRQIYWTLVWLANTHTKVQWTAARERRSLLI
jgi:hypothetical protein